MELPPTLWVSMLAVAAGSGLGAIIITWFNFLPFWKKNKLGNKGGLIGGVAFFHQISTVIGVLPVAIFAGSYMGEGAMLDEWYVLAIMIISCLLILIVNRSIQGHV